MAGGKPSPFAPLKGEFSKTGTRKAKRKTAKMAAKLAAKSPSVEELLEMAEALMESFPANEAGALSCLEQAARMSPDNPEVLSQLSAFLTQCEDEELQDPSRAQQLLERAVELQPHSGSSKFLELAQLHEGETAVNLFRKALEILQRELDAALEEGGDEGERKSSDIRRTMSSACCAVAEVFLTDLWVGEDVETLNKTAIQEALTTGIAHCPDNFDCHQVAAVFFKTLGNLENASKEADAALKVLRAANEANDVNVGQLDMTSSTELPHIPPVDYAARLNFSATLVDIGKAQEALEVLEGLRDENQLDMQAWYLTTLALMVQKEFTDATTTLGNAKALLEQVVKGLKGAVEGVEFVGLWKAKLEDLEAELESRKLEAPQKADDGDEEIDGDDDSIDADDVDVDDVVMQ